MSERPVVLVIRDPEYGSAIMRGLQQAESLNEVGLPTRLLSVGSDRSSILAVRESVVVLVKDAVVEDELVLALSLGDNTIVWDVVDFLAHKPPLAGTTGPAELVASMAVSSCLDHALVMTESAAPLLRASCPTLTSTQVVDHQVDRALRESDPDDVPDRFGVVYLGAPENVPAWVPRVDDFETLLTSDAPFAALVPRAGNIPFHVDFRNPERDRRDLKPWTKAATALRMGALPIAEDAEANRAALGADYPLLFDGTRRGFLGAVDRARAIWADGEFRTVRDGLADAARSADPLVVAGRMADHLRSLD